MRIRTSVEGNTEVYLTVWKYRTVARTVEIRFKLQVREGAVCPAYMRLNSSEESLNNFYVNSEGGAPFEDTDD